jgi:hypothetical protein
MSRFASDIAFRRFAISTVGVTIGAALVFCAVQNYGGIVGGAISLPKALWLGLAILFWFVLPFLIVLDRRTPAFWNATFLMLLVLMAVRGVAELPMMYWLKNWRPIYGIAHDVLCIGSLSVAVAVHAWKRDRIDSPQSRLFQVHGIATATLFIPEIYFAWYMYTNFSTTGRSAIYFVPSDPRYAVVLTVTTVVDCLASAYLIYFLFNWLYASVKRAYSSGF